MYRNYRLFDMAYVSLTSFFFEVRHVIFWGRSLKVLKAALRKSNSVEICEQVVLLTRSANIPFIPPEYFVSSVTFLELFCQISTETM